MKGNGFAHHTQHGDTINKIMLDAKLHKAREPTKNIFRTGYMIACSLYDVATITEN